MLKAVLIFTSIYLVSLSACSRRDSYVKIKHEVVNAPFEMPSITYPDFSESKKLLITDFGALQNSLSITTEAIENAINRASQLGGGTVVVPTGDWLTGSIHFKSNVNLHLEEGAKLIFSEYPSDYLPPVHTSWEGMECYNYSPLIYGYKCHNIAITGEGLVEAKMDVWENWFERPVEHLNSLKHLYELASTGSPVKERNMVNDTSHLRPQFIQFNRCNNVLIEGISIKNSPFWTIHPYLSENVIIRNVKIDAHGHNNDGIDPEMVKNMLIENCEFDVFDDVISIKAGRNQDAWRLNTPTQNVVIKNCRVKNGHQLLAIGSEISGGINNVFMDSCTVDKEADLKYLTFIKTNERRGGYVKNIHVSDIDLNRVGNGILGIETDVLYQWRNLVPTYERRLTSINDIHLDNLHANNVKFIAKVFGQKELPIDGIYLNNVRADTIQEVKYIFENTENYFLKDNDID